MRYHDSTHPQARSGSGCGIKTQTVTFMIRARVYIAVLGECTTGSPVQCPFGNVIWDSRNDLIVASHRSYSIYCF